MRRKTDSKDMYRVELQDLQQVRSVSKFGSKMEERKGIGGKFKIFSLSSGWMEMNHVIKCKC